MDRKLSATFNIYISDDFEERVAEYYDIPIEDVTDEYILEFIENHMNPANSNNQSFEVEGGNTAGWFIQNIKHN